MKKLIIFTLMFLFLFSYVSAIRVDYSPNDKGVKDMKAVVKDTILWDLIAVGEQGTMELKSHKTPTEIIEVGTGWQVTMIYDTNFGQSHKDILGNVYFYDLKTDEEVEREYKFVYWGEEERTREVCNEYQNITNSTTKELNYTTECVSYINESYTYEGWLDYNSKDLPKGQIRLGLMTNVLYKDKIDGVWEIQGKKIDKHAGWTSELSVGLVSYYKLDETSGTTAYDSLGINNGTNNGATINVAGKIGKAYSFDGIDDFMNTSINVLAPTSTQNQAFSVWFYNDGILKTTGGRKYTWGVFGVGNSGSTGTITLLVDGTNNSIYIQNWNFGGGDSDINISTGVNIGWHHIVINKIAQGRYDLWLDGVKKVDNFERTATKNATLIMQWKYASEYYKTIIDELGIWNRSLSDSEISGLYNNGDGITYEEIGLNITLLSPIDYYNSTNQTIDFSANLTDEGGLGIQNVSLVINDTIYQTNTSGVSGLYSFIEDLDDGYYEWKLVAYDNWNEKYETPLRNLTIDTTSPNILITSPLTHYDYLEDNQSLDLNYTITDPNGVDKCWVRYQPMKSEPYRIAHGLIPPFSTQEDIFLIVNTRGNTTINFTAGGWEPSINTLNLGYCDIFKAYSPEAQNLLFDCDGVVTEAYSFSDFVYALDVFVYNIASLDCNTNTTFTYQYPYNNITIYANDTFGNTGNVTRSWDVDLTYLGMDYQNETISTTSNPFSVKYAYDTNKFTGTMAYLNYSGTSYLMNSTANNSEITANKDLIIATSLPINYTFGFKVELARVGQSPITYSINNFTQLVKPIDLSLCNATQTTKYIQYNIFKEGTTTPLNASFEWTGSLWIDGDGTISQPFSYKDESENKSTFSFCTNYTEQNIKTTGLVSYLRSDSDRRDYVLTNLLMTNQSQTINLFLLPINQSSIVTITLYDYNNNYIANGKINVLRWDIGTNTFSTVATLTTNQDGRTFVNLDLFNSYYKFVVTYQGRVILTTDPDRIGSTEISLRASLGSPSDYEPFRHITRDMTYNKNTHVVNFVWSDNSGAMARGCLVVYKNTPIGRQQVSRECSTSVSSILSYLATDNQTSYTAIGTIFLSSAYNSVYDDIVLNFEFGESIPSEIVGTKGYVLSFLLFGFIISATMATGMVMITAIGLPVAAWFVNMMGFLIIPNYIFITITSLSLLLIIMEAFKKK